MLSHFSLHCDTALFAILTPSGPKVANFHSDVIVCGKPDLIVLMPWCILSHYTSSNVVALLVNCATALFAILPSSGPIMAFFHSNVIVGGKHNLCLVVTFQSLINDALV